MSKLEKYTKIVKAHDRDLFAVDAGVCLQIHRKTDSIEKSFLATPSTQYILSLTDTWKPDGKPVEWGAIPLLEQLKSMDSWGSGFDYHEMSKKRERNESSKERSKRNEIRAIASELRRDFARATNDINTSNLEKVDRRREKDGNCK